MPQLADFNVGDKGVAIVVTTGRDLTNWAEITFVARRGDVIVTATATSGKVTIVGPPTGGVVQYVTTGTDFTDGSPQPPGAEYRLQVQVRYTGGSDLSSLVSLTTQVHVGRRLA